LFVAVDRKVVATLYNGIPGSGGASGSRIFSFDASQFPANATIYLAGTWAMSEEIGRFHYEQQQGGWRIAIGVFSPTGWPQLTLSVTPAGTVNAQAGQTVNYTVTVSSGGVPAAGATVGVQDLLCGRTLLTTGSGGHVGYSCTVGSGTAAGPYITSFEPAAKSGSLNSRDASRTLNVQ
jgi:uncharacterized repeat protein (TIGR01451 family)